MRTRLHALFFRAHSCGVRPWHRRGPAPERAVRVLCQCAASGEFNARCSADPFAGDGDVLDDEPAIVQARLGRLREPSARAHCCLLRSGV
eukprot:4567302-Pleurochrysis_carterae.AAC.1